MRRGFLILLILILTGALAVALGLLMRHGWRSSSTLMGARPIPEVVRASHGGTRVLFVGLDGADWELLDEYTARGLMPHLARLEREGRSGVLRTLHPPLSPLVWTTMMTGVGPLEHGILDFTRFHPTTRQREPITSDERRVPAVWNMASWGGRSVAVFGLWATWPAEPVEGVVVSDRLFSFQYRERTPPPGTVFPPERAAWALSALERAEKETGYEALRSYLPTLETGEYARLIERPDPYSHPVTALRRILVETRVYHELATSWYVERQPDLAVIYIQGTDTIGHVYAPYAPPRQEAISREDFDRYSRVPEIYFSYIDRLLGDYDDVARRAGAVLMIASDHGFRWKEDRPRIAMDFTSATAGRWHRDQGIYLMHGPGVAPSARDREGAGVVQVCATMLELLGLPASRGSIGPPLTVTAGATGDLFDYRTYFRRSRTSERHSDAPPVEADLDKLKSLGYIGAGEISNARPALAGEDPTRTAGSWNNEGLVLREAGRAREAIRAFETAISIDPRYASAQWNLSELFFAQNSDAARSDDLLVRAAANGLPDAVKAVVGRAIACQRAGDTPRSLSLLDAAIAATPATAELHLFRGRYRIDRHDCAGALADFQEAERLDARNPGAWASSGVARLCLGDRRRAAEDFRRSLSLDPDQPELRRGLERGF